MSDLLDFAKPLVMLLILVVFLAIMKWFMDKL